MMSFSLYCNRWGLSVRVNPHPYCFGPVIEFKQKGRWTCYVRKGEGEGKGSSNERNTTYHNRVPKLSSLFNLTLGWDESTVRQSRNVTHYNTEKEGQTGSEHSLYSKQFVLTVNASPPWVTFWSSELVWERNKTPDEGAGRGSYAV